MARRLASLGWLVCLFAVVAVSVGQSPPSQLTGSAPKTDDRAPKPNADDRGDRAKSDDRPNSNDSSTQPPRVRGDRSPDDHRDGRRGNGRPDDERGSDDRHGDDHRAERRGGRGRFLFMLMDAVRRDGGPLELQPLLLNKEVQHELGLGDEFDTRVKAYFTQMQERLDEDFRAGPPAPETDWVKVFQERLARENEKFEELRKTLSEEQRDRLLGIYVQMRNLRSVSNRLVAVDKLGMSADEATKLRNAVNTIRDETMNESTNDRPKHLFESGADRTEFEKFIRKNQEKIDARIEKLLDKKQLEKLNELRGKPVAAELLQSLERPPAPPMRPGPRNQ